VLILTGIFAGVVSGFVHHATADFRITRRVLEYQKARLAAEMGLDYAVVCLRNYVLENGLHDDQGRMQEDLDEFVESFQAQAKPAMGMEWEWDLAIEMDGTLHEDESITEGTQVRGLRGDFRFFTVTSHARLPDSGIEANSQIRLQAVGLFLIRYAIFYEDDLEFFPGPNMTISGPVHSNGRLFLGTNNRLYFQDRMTSVRTIQVGLGKDGRSSWPGTVEANDANGFPEAFRRIGPEGQTITLDSRYARWVSEALQVWDSRVLSGSHGINSLRPPIAPVDEPGDLIQRALPTSDPDYQETTEAEKFMNRAEMIIHVDAEGHITATTGSGRDVTQHLNTPVTLVTNGFVSKISSEVIRVPIYRGKRIIGYEDRTVYTTNNIPLYAKTSHGEYQTQGNGTLDVSQTNFYDQREDTALAPVDVYVDRLIPELNRFGPQTGGTPGLVYITRDPPADDPDRMPVVRIRNGRHINTPTGLSIVSDLPVYMEGHYNVQNTTVSLVAGDAVTMLSSQWQDAYSAESLGSRPSPTTTTNNVVVMTGNTETAGSAYNGGVENVLRFLENWNNRTYRFRGSLIDLWYSRHATGRWVYGGYYTAPTRDWGYDPIYRTRNPPGMTRVLGLEEIEWAEISPAEAREHGVGHAYGHAHAPGQLKK
jgi:hypothetical protein